MCPVTQVDTDHILKKEAYTYFFLYFILFLLAQGPLCYCHFANTERLQFAFKQRLQM